MGLPVKSQQDFRSGKSVMTPKSLAKTGKAATTPKNPRAIIDRKALVLALDELVSWSGFTAKTQPQVLTLFKDALARGVDEIKKRFDNGDLDGIGVIHANAYHMDQLIRTIHEFAMTKAYPVANPTTGEQMAVVATGGYGRGQLAPQSDIDLMFLLPYKLTAHSEQVVEFTLYTLWDLGLKVGHATRSIDEVVRLAAGDLTIHTSLLDARLLLGNRSLFNKFLKKFEQKAIGQWGRRFVEEKLAERDARHERMGDTRYVLEPNIKEGKGGLRDLQTLFWIAKSIYRVDDMAALRKQGVLTASDIKTFSRAENFLWTTRCHLHYLSGRAEERLSFNVQAEIGERMGYRDHAGSRGVERFMKHYFLTVKNVGDLTRVLCAVLEEQQKKSTSSHWLGRLRFKKREIEGFRVDGGRLNFTDDHDLATSPVKLLQLFQLGQKHQLDIHPKALRKVTQNLRRIDAPFRADPKANDLFLDILTGPDADMWLLRLNEVGILGRFIPDFGRVVAQMQYDMYHVYTVDEHTIRAIGILHGIETGELKQDHPVACSVIGEAQSLRVLYLAVFLHDIAKGRGGDHSVLGAAVARKMGDRFRLGDWETETIAWLVENHLVMSNTAFKRDIEDAKTVSDFAAIVQSPERLRLLLILTVADIRAVGPNVWNNWKAGLLRDLYAKTLETLNGDVGKGNRTQRIQAIKQALRERLADWTVKEIEAHFDRGHGHYWLANDLDTLVAHANMMRHVEQSGVNYQISARPDAERAATEVIVYAPDHPGLFAAIAGAIALSGGNIVDAKAQTLSHGMALDTFRFQDINENMFSSKSRLDKLKQRIARSIEGTLDPGIELKKVQEQGFLKKTGAFKVPPKVLIDNRPSKNHTVIEINGRDRKGLLHDVSKAMTDDGLQVSSAHISTFGERVVDVFYVKDVFGLKMERDDKIETVRQHLMAAIGGEPTPAG